jgi:hypothetical protein
MVVYVDDMYRYPMGQFGRMRMSHMIADTEEELHAMADAIGIARRWYQGDHYDIGVGKRDLAILRGAVPIGLKVLARMVAMRKRTGNLPSPDEAAADMLRPLPLHIRLMIGPVVVKRSPR